MFLLLFCFSSRPSFAQKKETPSFSFIALGDMPYFLPQDYGRFENVIHTINFERPLFSVFVGDIKSSSTPCTEESYKKMRDYFGQFDQPLVYTPGDNEWTDCSKKEAGSYDPEERLEVIRKLFFFDSLSFGKKKIPLISQSSHSEYVKFVENKRWEYGGVAFATVHVVGSHNFFLSNSKNGNREFFERDKADIAWLEEVFAEAQKNHNQGIVLFVHADMFFQGKQDVAYQNILTALQRLTLAFGKQVLLINGDSHEFLVDKPLQKDPKGKNAISNFTRIQVFGENEMHAVKITVNPSSTGLFQIEPLLVEANK
jgi:hypothetical protein